MPLPNLKPFFRTELGTLYNGKTEDIISRIGMVDCMITDPPYNLDIDYNTYNDDRDDYRIWCTDWFHKSNEIVNGPISISCGIANIGMWHCIRQPDWVLCWHKPAAMGRCPIGFNNWEPILLYGKTLQQKTDVITAPIITSDDVGEHPCPKPLSWATKQLFLLSKPNDIVFDPFGGSGTVAAACEMIGRRWILFEQSEKYCKHIEYRLREGGLRKSLKKLSR